ncbi:ribose 1,5-bisphosphokinase [Pseudodesulfovibrio profundus]|uniref:Ribose 1,5-bisphosphate phosphokinase PhnN n=1 Tax=Pseudodesulfovibrio profundus TaxID=57320 RepID=A0A2C8FCW7_9BACT|nr:phosphonate metabolism protein/1,5-bisphosphokinase (PRPP-forming) PhnN [Pseudodesulfovibrio profundus]SOB60270.1 ribose 1,5-bisphosphokinase [Pseudodesulfovibrio profundus]
MTHGKLIYVIGPSGCGKDSVMGYARESCPGSEAIFTHRYITRSADAGGENHIFLHPDEFQARLERGLFSLNWDSHGFRYAIGREIDMWMEAGFNVVMNGSRAYLPEASLRYQNIIPVLINVETPILKERLIARGRESETEIARRLERAGAYEVNHTNLELIDNSGELPHAGQQILQIIRGKRMAMKEAV